MSSTGLPDVVDALDALDAEVDRARVPVLDALSSQQQPAPPRKLLRDDDADCLVAQPASVARVHMVM